MYKVCDEVNIMLDAPCTMYLLSRCCWVLDCIAFNVVHLSNEQLYLNENIA